MTIGRISLAWQPCEAVKRALSEEGFTADVIENQRNRFVFFWLFNSEYPKVSYDTIFYRYMTEMYDPDAPELANPVQMSETWQPSQAAYDALDMQDVSREFAEKQIQSFVLYWCEDGSAHRDWSTRFVQHAKYQHDQEVERRIESARRERDSSKRQSTRDSTLEEDLLDRSWVQ